MEALYGQNGRVHAWFDRERARIYDLRGRNLAFVDGESIYDWRGRHIAWWIGECVRDRTNAAAYFTSEARSIGVIRPIRAIRPLRPIRAIAPAQPFKQARPIRPVRRAAWSTELPF